MRQYSGHNTSLGHHTDQGPCTASEVFLIFTTQLHVYSYLCNYPEMFVIYTDKREELQQEYSQHPILPSPHFRWVVTVRERIGSVF